MLKRKLTSLTSGAVALCKLWTQALLGMVLSQPNAHVLLFYS